MKNESPKQILIKKEIKYLMIGGVLGTVIELFLHWNTLTSHPMILVISAVFVLISLWAYWFFRSLRMSWRQFWRGLWR